MVVKIKYKLIKMRFSSGFLSLMGRNIHTHTQIHIYMLMFAYKTQLKLTYYKTTYKYKHIASMCTHK